MAARITIATDSARAIEAIVPAQHRWFFTWIGEEGRLLLALHPRTDDDHYRGVTLLTEATRPALLIVVDHPQVAAANLALLMQSDE
jgi:hypothetical protein